METLFFIFALICLSFFCLLLLEYLPAFWSYIYPVQNLRLEAIGILTLGIALLIPYFLNKQLRAFKEPWFSIIMLTVLLSVFFLYHGRYDYSAQMLSLLMGISGLLITLIAVYRREKGAAVVLSAILLGMAANWLLYFDYSLYLSFGFLLLAMLYLLTLRSREIEHAYRQSLLLSERLKTELLKKSIQPHFLMNTLTTLIDWVEEAPISGVEMIRAIAAELEILSRVADHQLISIKEEIELCTYHLQVMRFRKEINYKWEASGIIEEENLPPAILHTVLENGITHSKPLADGSIRFHLKFERQRDVKIYTLETFAENRTKSKEISQGTGFKYITARLNESYGTKWQLISEASTEGWTTIIKLWI